MENNLIFYLSDFLYKYFFSIYRILYKYYKNQNDKFEIELLEKIIRPGFNIIDIGANIGFYSLLFTNLTGKKGNVHCFEPDLTNFNHLKKAVKKSTNVIINNKAISDRDGLLTFYTSHRLNVDHRTYPVEKYKSTYQVDSISIDKYIDSKYKVDFIKMDIQGAEFPAFKGMEATLRNNQDIIVFMEIMPSGLKSFGVTVNTVISYIRSLGFIIYLIKNKTVSLLEDADIQKYELYKEDDYDNLILSRNLLKI
jgi:FkbM family methyltransferase